MTKMIVGIDISQKTFDVAYSDCGAVRTGRFKNDAVGFPTFGAVLGGSEAHCVMEASGPYYLPLATFLFESGVGVSVVNPLVVKRFSQMRLLRAKTDRQDAKCLMMYGATEQPQSWRPSPLYINELSQLQALLDQYLKQRTALNNQLHAQKASGVPNEAFSTSAQKVLETLDAEIKDLEQQMEALARKHHQSEMEALLSIPGIGRKTALVLTVVTHGFSRFDSAKQLASYVGICPRIFQSGTSVRGKSRICKLGMARVRQLLYLCAMQAAKVNQPCKELYERLLKNGKPKMKALIAVAHKLLRQALAIAKSQTTFVQNFSPFTCT